MNTKPRNSNGRAIIPKQKNSLRTPVKCP